MQDYKFEITDPDYWRDKKGYSLNGGKDLNLESLVIDLCRKIRSREILVSGNLLLNFGAIETNMNVAFLMQTRGFQIKDNVFQVSDTDSPKKKLAGHVVRGVKVRNENGPLPYRSRI